MQNIGIVLYTTGNNEKNLKTALKSVRHIKDQVIIVCDGELKNRKLVNGFKFKEFTQTLYPAACYNHGIRHFLTNSDVEYIFILSDQIAILDDSVYTDYINVSNQTNIGLFVTGKDEDDPYGRNNNLRLTVAVKNGYNISLNKGFNGNLILLKKSTVVHAGFFDERYKGAFEIGDYYKKCADAGITTQFGWFADVQNVQDNILYQNNTPTWQHPVLNHDSVEDRIIRGMKVFYMKYKAQFQDLLNIYTSKDVISRLQTLVSRNFE